MAKEKLSQFAYAQQNSASIELSHLLDGFEAEIKENGFRSFDDDTLRLLIAYCDSIIQAASKYMSAAADLEEYDKH